MARLRIGQALIEAGFLTPAQLDEALADKEKDIKQV